MGATCPVVTGAADAAPDGPLLAGAAALRPAAFATA